MAGEKKVSADPPLHTGHRSRLRRKYLQYGADVLEKHELLELALFYVIPYRDTNPLAHRLLRDCGSFAGVLSETWEKKSPPSGVGQSTIDYLHLLNACVAGYYKSKESVRSCDPGPCASDPMDSLMLADTAEGRSKSVCVFCLDRRKRIIGSGILSLDKDAVPTEDLFRLVQGYQPSFAALVRMCPSDIALPSLTDFTAAREISKFLGDMGISFLDYILLDGRNDYISFADSGFLRHTDRETGPLVIQPPHSEDMFTAISHFDPLLDQNTLLCDILGMIGPQAACARAPVWSPSPEEHRLLSDLLRYALPRRSDASEAEALATRLLRRFGSLAEVLEADLDTLSVLPGVGTGVALYLHLLMDCVRLCCEAAPVNSANSIVAEIGNYMVSQYIGRQEESVRLVCLDADKHIIGSSLLGDGDTSSVTFSTRAVFQCVSRFRPAFVVLVHNHPSGIALPSSADFAATQELSDFLKKMGIPLLDHIIMDCGRDFLSFADSGFLKKNAGNTRYIVVPRPQTEKLAAAVSHFDTKQDES